MDKTTALKIIESLTIADVLQAYSGKPGCACGCRGNYRITESSRKEADDSRGYPHGDGDVNLRQVSKVLNQVRWAARHNPYFEDLNRAPAIHVNAADDLQYVTAQMSERRVYTVYLTKAARRSRGVEKGYDL
jgi:hypothetical protein